MGAIALKLNLIRENNHPVQRSANMEFPTKISVIYPTRRTATSSAGPLRSLLVYGPMVWPIKCGVEETEHEKESFRTLASSKSSWRRFNLKLFKSGIKCSIFQVA